MLSMFHLRTFRSVLTLRIARLLPLILAICWSSAWLDAADAEGWPREIHVEAAEVVIYQPQLEEFSEDKIRSRAAVSVRATDAEGPVFGTVWIEAHVDTDLDTRLVSLRSIEVPRVRFAGASEEHQAQLAKLLEEQIPTWNLEMSLDRLLAGMEDLEDLAHGQSSFDDAPPVILFAASPTVLVMIDGQPAFWPLSETKLQSITNSAFFIVQKQSGGAFYLYAGSDLWYTSPALKGEWKVTDEIPAEVRAAQPEDPAPDESTESAGDEPAQPQDNTPPAILVATEPTEVIITTGKPTYKPIGEGELLMLDNTEADVLLEGASQRHFVLLAGRWYSSAGLQGPWSYVAADALPASFAEIPVDSDAGHMLAWVAGTEMAREVALDAYVPQTSAIARDASIEVSYDGEPKFEPVEQTTLQYAVNTQSQVILSGTTYYCVSEGVWYVAASAQGPWMVATEIPAEVQNIPPSSPVYNTKYVYVFESTPEVVYVGYYPGYTHSYYYHGCIVYGTGWYYPPYVHRGYCYPRHSTWGFRVRYNPYHGWSVGLSWSNGPFTFVVGRGGAHGWFGPAWRHSYRHGYGHGYNRGWQHGFRHGVAAGAIAGRRPSTMPTTRNIYNQASNRARNARPAQRPAGGTTRPGPSTRPSAGASRPGGATPGTSDARDRLSARAKDQPQRAQTRENNVYSDRDGNVHRRTNEGTWQSRDGGNWKSTDRSAGGARPSTGQGSGARPSTGTGSGSRPSTGQSPSTRPSTRPAPSNTRSRQQSLNRSYQSRQRGTQRSQGSQRSPSPSRARSGGGGRRR